MRTAVGSIPMGKLLEKTIALVVACAIALQAPLVGLAFSAHAGLDPFSIICASENSSDHNNIPGHQGGDCGNCILACGGASPVAVTDETIILIAVFPRHEHHVSWFEAPASSLRHQPCAARAPPIPA